MEQRSASSRGASSVRDTAASFASGCASGVLSAVVLQPTDLLRTRMQGEALRLRASGATAASGDVSLVRAARAAIGKSGVRGLWKGTQAAVLRVGPGIGVYMMVIDVLHRHLGEDRGDGRIVLTPLGAMGAAGFARAVASAVVSPITVVKTRIEYYGSAQSVSKAAGEGAAKAASGRPVGTIAAVRNLARAEGARGLFRGLAPTIASAVPFSALYYALYTNLQERMREVRQPRMAKNLAASLAAAVAATLVTQPADVLRTQAQLSSSMGQAPRTMMGLVRRCRNLGMRTLFVGSTPRFAKRTLQAALVWTVYEELLRAIKKEA